MECSKEDSYSNVGIVNNPEVREEEFEDMQKKCGEILINENENFNFLCIFCGTLMKDIEVFIKHIKIYHMKLCRKKECLKNHKKQLSSSTQESLRNHEKQSLPQRTYRIESTSTSNSKSNIEFIAFNSTQPSKKRRQLTSPKPRDVTRPNNEEIIEYVSFDNAQSPEPMKIESATISNDELKTEYSSFDDIEVNRTSDIENLVYYTYELDNTNIIKELEESPNYSTVKEKYEVVEDKCSKELLFKEQKEVTADDIEIQKLELEIQQMQEDDVNKGLQIRIKNETKNTRNSIFRRKTICKVNVSCNICNKTFYSEKFLNSHIRYDHIPINPLFQQEQLTGKSTVSDPLKCRYCGKKFASRRTRYQHECSHTGEKPFECDICHKRFSGITTLHTHLQIHKNERRYKCEMCPSAFNDRSNLTVHMRRHKNEKNFKCNYCDKTFVCTTDRNIHERVHTKERPYQCTKCGVCLISAGKLRDHIISYHNTNEKPHKCQYCEKSYLKLNEKLEHERIHTGEKPYVCEICSVSFHRKKSYIRHGKTHSK